MFLPSFWYEIVTLCIFGDIPDSMSASTIVRSKLFGGKQTSHVNTSIRCDDGGGGGGSWGFYQLIIEN